MDDHQAVYQPPAGVAPSDEVVHQCPSGGSGIMPCCGRTPFEVPRYHRMAIDPALVTCTASSGPSTTEAP